MEHTLSQYRYSPLTSNRSIRVFTLYPSRDVDAPLQGQLSEVDLDFPQPYEAVSYLCGDKEPGFEVQILSNDSDGQHPSSVVPVTPNCLTALHILRDRVKPRTLWVDAVCIDQGPTSEKSHQVALMTEIFENAERVLIWLNPGTQGTIKIGLVARLFQLVGWMFRFRLLRLYERDEQTNGRMPSESRVTRLCDRFISGVLADRHYLLLKDSFNAPFLNRYFHRVWTVQEIAMAREIVIHYGMTKIAWCDFVASGLFTVKRGGFARNQQATTEIFRDSEKHWYLINSLEAHFVFPDIYGVEALYNDSNQRNTLQRYTPGTAELALFRSKCLDAMEPKDKAYAMLWAFSDSSTASAQLRQVDYEKPLDVIYTEFSTAAFVKTHGSSLQLYLVNSVSRLSSLPSWVPDWSQTNSMSYSIWISRLRDFRAAGEESLKYRLSIEGAILRISGLEHCGMRALIRFSAESRQRNLYEAKADELVEALTDTAFLVKGLIDTAKYLSGPEQHDGILESVHLVLHSQKFLYKPGSEDGIEFYARPKEKLLSQRDQISVGLVRVQVFNAVSFLVEEDNIPHATVKASLADFLSQGEVEIIIADSMEHPNLSPFLAVVVALSPYIDLYHFLHIILLDHRDKDLFITDQGEMGMTFEGLQKSDQVVLWQGCPSPMVVRTLHDTENGEDARYLLHGPAYVRGIMNGEAWIGNNDLLSEYAVL